MAKHHLYDESPHMEHDGSGKVHVKKTHTSEEHKMDKDQHIPKNDQVSARHTYEHHEMKHRHVKEHLDMHLRHAHERLHHPGHMAELHTRHHVELKDMHGRHESEHKSMHTRHEKEHGAHGGAEAGAGGATGKRSEPIQKAEHGTKG